MTTTYGTIPTSTHPHAPPSNELISRATTQLHSHLTTLRPWSHLTSLSLPRALPTIISRATTNIPYFLTNYTLILLATILISLITHPLSLILFAAIIAAWVVLYFTRDAPLVVLGRVVDDVIVFVGLCCVSLLFLFVSGVEDNIVVGSCIGLVLVLVHSLLVEISDDDGDDRLPLRNTASDGYSS